MIIAQMATWEPRFPIISRAVDSLKGQVDRLLINVNGDQPPPVDAEFNFSENIGDRGKVNFSEKGYIFLVDDDIVYPYNYIREMTRIIDEHDRQVIVGVHGAILRFPVTDYYRCRRTITYTRPLASHSKVHILGTGTVAFHTDYFQIGLEDAQYNNMLDCFFAVKAQNEQKKMLCVARKNNWLQSIRSPVSIYSSRPTKTTEVINRVKDWKFY